MRGIAAIAVVASGLVGCEGSGASRLRWVSSTPAGAAWSFVVDDHGQGATVLVDERPRVTACDRAGRTLRCQLRGLFPGGHTVEARVSGAVLRRSALLGRSWPERPLMIRARTPAEVRGAADADAAILPGDHPDLPALVEDAHRAGIRALAECADEACGTAAVERAGADGVLGPSAGASDSFPETRAFSIDKPTSATLSAALAEARVPPLPGSGVLDTRGPLGAALAIAAGHAAVVDVEPQQSPTALPNLNAARRRHAALARGTSEPVAVEGALPGQAAFRLRWKKDEVLVLVNLTTTPWAVRPPGIVRPLDLLGSSLRDGVLEVRARDVALVIPTPGPDPTQF
jgi:hypothetical protein